MVLNAEMRLRASLMRKESRGSHYRADYPYRDDKEWLAWTTIKKGENGEMVVDREEIPERMKTNNHLPYAEKYTICFPGEEEAIAKLSAK